MFNGYIWLTSCTLHLFLPVTQISAFADILKKTIQRTAIDWKTKNLGRIAARDYC